MLWAKRTQGSTTLITIDNLVQLKLHNDVQKPSLLD